MRTDYTHVGMVVTSTTNAKLWMLPLGHWHIGSIKMKVALTKLKNNPKNPRVIRDEKFNEVRPNYNRTGDKSMNRLIINAKF